MFIINSYPVAIFFTIVTMLCWGSWANTQKLTTKDWRFETFYWDYVWGILIMSLILAFTMGSLGEGGRSFMEDIKQANNSNLGSAFLGGIVFNAANILLVAAITISGMSVAFPVGIGLALVIGVFVNYMDNSVGNFSLIIVGVVLITIAIILNAVAYKQIQKGNSSVSTKGLLLSVAAGILMGYFYKYVALSMFPDFNMPEDGKLSPYSAVVLFSIGIVASNFLFNTLLMKKPFVGEPVPFSAYFKGSSKNHMMGVLGGFIWCIGMSFNIIASGKAGAAISYGLGQGATVVAAIWGIFIWKEFKDASKSTNRLLYLMLLCYLVGLGILVISK
ncbi:MAG: GRP family sugar transporter [Leadbetterella sp.]